MATRAAPNDSAHTESISGACDIFSFLTGCVKMSGRTYSYEQCAKHIGLPFLGLNINNVNRVEPLEPRRLLAGELDPTFGGGDGIVTTDFTGFGEEAHATALYPDGRIVAA